MLYDVGEYGGGGGVYQRGVLQKGGGGDGQSLFERGTAIQVSLGAWQHPPAAIAMDGDGRGRRVDCRYGELYGNYRGDLWKSGGFRDNGREQYGRGNGALHRYNRDIVSFPVNFNNENLYPKGGENPYK